MTSPCRADLAAGPGGGRALGSLLCWTNKQDSAQASWGITRNKCSSPLPQANNLSGRNHAEKRPIKIKPATCTNAALPRAFPLFFSFTDFGVFGQVFLDCTGHFNPSMLLKSSSINCHLDLRYF